MKFLDQMKKIFILGVGAQKGGTTWLHRQLNSNQNIDLGFRKEYHILDAITDMRQRGENKDFYSGFRDRRIKKILELNSAGKLGKNLGRQRKRSKHIALELAFIDNLDHYFDYFDYLYLKNPDVEAVGDITPNYAILKPPIFRMVKRKLEQRGFTVKVVFLMRDPVERAWSLARMKKRNMEESKQEKFDEIKYISKKGVDGFAHMKSSYEFTIKNLEKIFEQQNIYYGFYETLFNEKSYEDIQKFLGISINKFDVDEVFNASPKTTHIPPDTNKELVERFRSTYEYMYNRFGDSMTKIWERYGLLESPQA